MVASLYTTHLITLHDRLTRMRIMSPDLLRATGLDDWLPPLDQLVATLPRLDRLATELSEVEHALRHIRVRHGQADAPPLPPTQLDALLAKPCQQLQAQSMSLTALF
ncbi:MAG: hypothetical protein JO171_18990 [Paludibacterium sp.]|uniref:hypothetical protein n=1 Tax=Paludibacterium sp. TaxID=1917523 RepID=UPI0025FEEC4C|nr:hypothetical protein [Paludibacterium sp.]MBV8049242.1 hypothetical protein [Paludibacterium sp.]MBV8646686.1 hypothetical protein [Paludibacterium sp.]